MKLQIYWKNNQFTRELAGSSESAIEKVPLKIILKLPMNRVGFHNWHVLNYRFYNFSLFKNETTLTGTSHQKWITAIAKVFWV